jgi:hypothetical protein
VKIYGGRGAPRWIWEEIETKPTVVNPKVRFIYRSSNCTCSAVKMANYEELSCPLPDCHELLSKLRNSVLARFPAFWPPVTMTVSVWPC